ncbi:MAG: YncE family protein [Acidibrevibacterium sp.]|jgi:DNA-binding beta-propeller fold protein YncE|uniref:YncE family protein n=1 Tax=Acidibrevibacterium fodinaquatile TaxID=1969806 RepID=UPI0023A8036B|nr:YncE family protein [Acidibrevibacterium fodinaquatile]MCA7119459.1 YncE family protein [Acidibrevibacterium fodinaquatile]
MYTPRLASLLGGAAAAAWLTLAPPARAADPAADFALSANDNHTTIVNGKMLGIRDAKPDTLSVIDLSVMPPRLTASLAVPFSDVGPPMAVTISANARFALVTASTKADPTKADGTSPDDRLSVVDLTSSPPRVVETLHAGAGASAVRISPDGRMALVANRFEGTISIFAIDGMHLEPAGKFALDNPKSQPVGIVFSHDGSFILVSRLGDHMVSLVRIAGGKLSLDPRPITTGVSPDTMDTNAAGTLAAVSNVGRSDGDVDTVSLIDLTAQPPRTIDTIGVPNGPEAVKFSPDGKYLAVNAINGTLKPAGTPFFNPGGVLSLYAVEKAPTRGLTSAGTRLRKLAEASDGGWTQGVAFSRDGRLILVQNMREHEIQVFRWHGGKLIPGVKIPVPGGPAAIATPWP